MIHQGMAVICRTEEEFDALIKMVNEKTSYTWSGRQNFGRLRNHSVPVRISFNIRTGNSCISQCNNLNWELNPGITEVHEASDLLHNIIISMKLKGE